MKRSLIRIDLVTETPLAIAASFGEGGIDKPLARNPAGEIVVPPSSIAGSLRAHVEEKLPDHAESIFGSLESGISRLTVAGTRFLSAPTSSERKQTAVDRHRGAAKDKTLRTNEQVNVGAELRVMLLIDGDFAAMDALLETLRSFHPVLGRGRSTGMGTTRQTALHWECIDLSTPAGLSQWIRGGGYAAFDTLANSVEPAPRDDAKELRTYDFRIVDGLLIDPKSDENDTDKGNTVVSAGTLPASSLKGVLRSRAHFILSTIAGVVDGIEEDDAQVLIDEMFGSVSQRSAIRCCDAIIEDPEWGEQHHVSIDRFTGGAVPRRLWKEQLIIGGTIAARIEELRPTEDWVSALLDAVACDMHDGLVGIGGRTGRGIGTISLDELPTPDFSLIHEALHAAARQRQDGATPLVEATTSGELADA